MTAGTPIAVARLRSSAARPAALVELWRFRAVVYQLLLRNLRVKYQRSALGFAWTLLNPLLTVGVLVVVFTLIVRLGLPDYWAFLLSGYFAWNFTQQLLTSATTVLREHAALRRSVAFPPEVPLLAAAGSRLVEFAVEMALALAALVALHHRGIPTSFALLPGLMLLQVLIAIGLALAIATVAAFYSDVQHVIPIVILILFYVTPVFYPASLVPEGLRPFYFANPMAGLLTLYHTVLYEGRIPPLDDVAVTALFAAAIWLVGYGLFNRYKTVFAELV